VRQSIFANHCSRDCTQQSDHGYQHGAISLFSLLNVSLTSVIPAPNPLQGYTRDKTNDGIQGNIMNHPVANCPANTIISTQKAPDTPEFIADNTP